MYIPMLIIPGSLLVGDREEASKIGLLLSHAKLSLGEAIIALYLYDKNEKEYWTEFEQNGEARSLADLNKRWKVSREVMPDSAVPEEEKRRLEQMIESQIVADLIAQSRVPRQLETSEILLYAHSFVYAVDGVQNLLLQCKNISLSATAAADALDYFKDAIPNLREIRNSIAHVDDRLLRIGKHNKPIDTPVMRLGNTYGGIIEYTLADGSLGLLEIKRSTLDHAVHAIQMLVDSLKWKGLQEVWPSA